MEREPEPWQTNAPAPFLAIGDVSVWALGERRFSVESTNGDEALRRYIEKEQAEQRADAERLAEERG